MKTPRVEISVAGRFHAFDLARELEALGMLTRLYTGYPAVLGPRFGVPLKRIRSVWSQEVLNRALSRLHRAGALPTRSDPWLAARYDRIVARRLSGAGNVFVGWSSQCLESLKRAKEFGLVSFLERGSSHILWQERILREERERSGGCVELPSRAIVERELAEYECADYIMVPSRFAAATFNAHGVDRDRILVNPYGVDLSLFTPKVGVERRAAGDVLRVIHVGRVSARKGVHYLIESIQRLPNAELTLVGQVEDEIKPLLGKPRINYVGPVPGTRLPAYYANADVFCLASVEEGLALVLAQGMAMGLPVIATPNTGIEELVTDGVEGFVVPMRDPEALAARLAALAADGERRREMGRRARARVGAGFSWAAYGARAAKMYAEALERRTDSGGRSAGRQRGPAVLSEGSEP